MDFSATQGEISSGLKDKPFLPIALLVLTCTLVYFNSLFNGFVFDDVGTIVENKYIKDLAKNLPSFFNASYFKIANIEASYRPVATFSYFLLYAVFDLNPFGYHLFSLVLHILNVILVYLLMGAIRQNKTTSFTAGLLFACHPALTEAINCVSYNEDLLATLFFLWSLLFYISGKAGEKKSELRFYFFSLIFFLCGLLSKEMAVTLPAVILLYDILSQTAHRQPSVKRIIKTITHRKFFYLGYIAIGLFYVSLRFFILSDPQASAPYSYGSLLERIIYLPAHLFGFLKIAVFPFNLNAYYVFSYPKSFFEITNIIAYMTILGLIVVSLLIYKNSKALSFGFWWFFITLFPVYNLVEIMNPIADRYLYLPLVGFCIAVSIFLNETLGRILKHRINNTGVVKILTIILILVAYSSMTVARNRDWKDNFSLWTQTVESSPNSSIAHGSLGRAYQDRGLFKEAIAEYKKAVQLNPADFKAYYNLGLIYEKQGLLEDAIHYYKKSIGNNPGYLDSHFNLANIYTQQGLLDRAVPHYKKAIEIDPQDFEARNNLGVVYASQGKLNMAVSEWQKVLEIDPENQFAKENILKAKKMIKNEN